LPCERGGAARGIGDLLQRPGQAGIAVVFCLQMIGITLDDGEDVVEIMGDTGGKLADGFQFLRVAELRLKILHFRDVHAVAMNHLARRNWKKRPGNGAVRDRDFFAEFLLR